MVAGFGMAMVPFASADDKITHEQIEEVMKKGFKAKLHEDLAANKEVLTNDPEHSTSKVGLILWVYSRFYFY